MADLEKYKSEQDRFLDERQTDEAYAKIDKREREHKARKRIDECYKYLTSEVRFPHDQAVEFILEAPVRRNLDFTTDEWQSLVTSTCRDPAQEAEAGLTLTLWTCRTKRLVA